MVKYYVVDVSGQKYGPAEVPMLNQWIAEGRLRPDSLLEDAATGQQTRASGIPALKFNAPPIPGGPPPAAASANPYDTPRPGTGPQPFAQGSNYGRGGLGQRTPTNINGQVGLAWLFTILAPITIYFLWFGLFISIYGIRAGASLLSYGMRGQGITIIVLNSLWIVMYILLRVFFVRSVGGGYRTY